MSVYSKLVPQYIIIRNHAWKNLKLWWDQLKNKTMAQQIQESDRGGLQHIRFSSPNS